MPTLLHIDVSPRAASVSSALTAKFASDWSRKNPGGKVIHHNTSSDGLLFVDEATIVAAYTPAEAHTPEQKKTLALSDKLIAELVAADTIVLDVPMWNFSIPASFKAWVDLVVMPDKTFAYGPTGPKGLLEHSKKVYVMAARGGAYSGASPSKSYDLQEPYLREILGFIGLTDITFIYAENQNRPDAAAAGREQAEAAVKVVFA